MPIYEYRCDQGHTFEVMRRMTDDTLTECITCGAPVEQIFHPITVHFKGKGFYNTDYGTKNRAREMQDNRESVGTATKVDGGEAKSGGEAKTADAAPASSSESKPAESKKSEAKPEKAPAKPPKQSTD
jgi:putative FmdB family regulatory protein